MTRPVLIVDDDPDIRDALTQLLEDEGYEVHSAGDGRQALERLRGGVIPGLVLLDLMMPIMNGWELRAEMKKDPALSGIPVVVITAGGSNIDRSSIDAEAFLPKPLDIKRLTDLVALHCR